MPRFLLTSLGVFALLFGAPRDAGAAELVRAGIAPSGVAPQIELATHGAAPREPTWSNDASGTLTGATLHSHGVGSPATDELPAAHDGSLDSSRSSHLRVLPDARAPPA